MVKICPECGAELSYLQGNALCSRCGYKSLKSQVTDPTAARNQGVDRATGRSLPSLRRRPLSLQVEQWALYGLSMAIVLWGDILSQTTWTAGLGLWGRMFLSHLVPWNLAYYLGDRTADFLNAVTIATSLFAAVQAAVVFSRLIVAKLLAIAAAVLSLPGFADAGKWRNLFASLNEGSLAFEFMALYILIAAVGAWWAVYLVRDILWLRLSRRADSVKESG
jgi:ribosomal protein L40E